MVATLAQQLYTMMVQTRLTAPISVKQFNQRLSHFSADNNAVWLLLQNHTRTEELKRRLQEAAEDHGPGETNPTPFLSCILFLISVFTSAGRHLGKEGPKAALPHFLPGLCMFIKGSEDIFILKLLHLRFAVSPSPVVFVFCAPFFSHPPISCSKRLLLLLPEVSSCSKGALPPHSCCSEGIIALLYNIVASYNTAPWDECWSETLLHLGNLHSGKAKLMAFWTYQFIRPLSFLVLIYWSNHRLAQISSLITWPLWAP